MKLVTSFRILLVVCAAACAESTTQPGGLHLERVEGFAPGSTAKLIGSGLSGLSAITLDGDTVDLLVKSDKEATFTVPRFRSCETDGRSIEIVANGEATLHAPLEVAGAVSLEVGESRTLSSADFNCLRLPARDEDYVLSAVRTSVPTDDVEDIKRMMFFRTWTEGRSQPVWARTSQGSAFIPEVGPVTNSAPFVYSTNPVAFDARYATAQEGSTVTMVDWGWNGEENIALCQLPKNQVPTYQARVIAATPRIVIAVDTRHPQAATHLDPASNAWLREAAQIADPLLVPTMRSIFDPSFQPLAGGGGRYYVVLAHMSGGTGFAYDGAMPGATGASQSVCPHASEMTTMRLNAAIWAQPQQRNAARLAGVLIHEYAHNVEARVHLKAGKPSNSAWFLNEAWATLAEETAARLASGQTEGAMASKVTSKMPGQGTLFYGLWGRQEVQGPWQIAGRYTVSAQMLHFLRELAGEVSPGQSSNPTLYQRLYSQTRDWTDHEASVPAISAAVGLSYAELVDRHAFASATAGLLPKDVIDARNLPHFRSWDLSETAKSEGPLNADFKGRASRTRNEYIDQWIPDGGYAAVYFMADGKRGISIEFLRPPDASGFVRITRTR
jgi:hypothetical protein